MLTGYSYTAAKSKQGVGGAEPGCVVYASLSEENSLDCPCYTGWVIEKTPSAATYKEARPVPIKVVISGQLSKPKIFCDHCLKIIETAEDGNYNWNLDEQEKGAILCFTHKHCCRPFEKAREPEAWGAEELRDLPIRIASNLGLSIAPETTDRGLTYCLEGEIHSFDLV
jgi:hypothetical protein